MKLTRFLFLLDFYTSLLVVILVIKVYRKQIPRIVQMLGQTPPPC